MNRKCEAIILSLIENLRNAGSWCGETHIQKSAYFLQELTGVPLELDFILYKHGPYSFDLRDELSFMQSDMILKSVSQQPYGPRICLDDNSEQLKQTYPKTINKYEKEIKFISQKLNTKGVSELEKLATALYVTKQPLTDNSIEKRAETINKLKPHVSIDAAKEAINMVDQIIQEFEAT